MFKIFASNSKVEKSMKVYLKSRKDIRNKLKRLIENPHKEIGAHPLQGRLKGKWSCWLGSNIRMIYSIDDFNNIIYIEAIGSHKIY